MQRVVLMQVVEKKKEEDDSSRLASQERFWQAKMREIMEGHRNEMDDIKTELEAMKKVTINDTKYKTLLLFAAREEKLYRGDKQTN